MKTLALIISGLYIILATLVSESGSVGFLDYFLYIYPLTMIVMWRNALRGPSTHALKQGGFASRIYAEAAKGAEIHCVFIPILGMFETFRTNTTVLTMYEKARATAVKEWVQKIQQALDEMENTLPVKADPSLEHAVSGFRKVAKDSDLAVYNDLVRRAEERGALRNRTA